jgi:flagellar motility protein MotE (MotC chaperone)
MTVENITELLKEIIENKEYGIGEKKEKILEVFENNHNADIAEALENLNEKGYLEII